jgi:hypothetical protein
VNAEQALYGAYFVKLNYGIDYAPSGSEQLRDDQRGARLWTRVIASQPCIRWIRWDRNHDAAMRIDSEAPGRQAQSRKRHLSHGLLRVTATSDRHRQPVAASKRAPKLSIPTTLQPSCSRCWTQDDTQRHLAGLDEPPKRDEQLAGQCYDHGLAFLASGDARLIPLYQSAVPLVD